MHRLLDVCDGLTAAQFTREVGGGFSSIQKPGARDGGGHA
jgi:hypothetical protein